MSTKKSIAIAALSLATVIGSTYKPAFAEEVQTVRQICQNGVCGQSKYYGGRVRISLGSQLTRTTHWNFKTIPGDQIEVKGGYSFDKEPGRSGQYAAQACGRSGLGSSTCTRWTTFRWRS